MNVRACRCTLVLVSSILHGCGTNSSGTPGFGNSGMSGASSAGSAASGQAPSGNSGSSGDRGSGSGSLAASGVQGGSGSQAASGSSGNASGANSGSTSGAASGSAAGSGSSSGTSTSGSASGPPPMFGPPPGVAPHAGQCIYPPVASQRKAPLFNADGKHPAPANPAGLILRLMNNCPLDLWVKAAGIPNGVVELAPKQAGGVPSEQVFDWPGGNGRISANEGSATGFNINFLEFTAAKGKALNVNLSNVDWVGLPVEVRGNDPTKCLTACYQPLSNMMNGCPPQLLDKTHNICQAPKNWCASHATDPLCQDVVAMAQAVVANDPKCSAGVVATPANLYGCGGTFWSASPYCCAEVTRGYKTDVNDPGKDPTQNCNYYKQTPYSTYSAYSQALCPFVYSFAYDDFNAQSGFAPCGGATEMDITYCPADP